MEDKKPKILDALRLIIAVLIVVGGLLIGIYIFFGVYGLFTDNHEDGFSGLVFLFVIPLLIGAFAYAILGIKWIKKYNKTKDTPLIKRTTGMGESIIKCIVASMFLTYASIPLVTYWTLDLIEAIKRNNLQKKLKGIQPEPEYKTNKTHPISDKHYCKYCGREVDYRYARFCEYCGAEIEYRE